ncbi:MAG: molybdopterin-dependent oxidoreductase, partial [Betaproteobacteria bacterium]|nr:molybdopterin-dependent oxidoreductase [Betaproteobacteria bacterium]
MIFEAPVMRRLAQQLHGDTAGLAAPSGAFDRRRFLKLSALAGTAGFALGLLPAHAQHADAAPAAPAVAPAGLKPFEQPGAFIAIDRHGTTTITINRMDMGQGIETGLAMVAAEELDADWSKVQSAFGNSAPNYVDPVMGMHLTGGSSSIKDSYAQYRALGARVRAMLVAAAAERWKA